MSDDRDHSTPMNGDGRPNPWTQKPGWLGYVVTVLLEIVLTAGLVSLMPYFPLGRFPIPYVLLTMTVAYLFAEGPAILSVAIGWFLFTYFFVPPEGIQWPLSHTISGWAQQSALLLGMIVVGAAMIQARKSNRRIQRLADGTLKVNEALASTNEELAAANEGLRATTEELHEEVAERKRVEEALRESEERVRRKLDSILSPEGDLANLELADIIDIAPIQSLMESFYEFAHIPMAIIDLKGKVLVGVGWQDVCTKFHRVNPETCKHCIDSDTLLSAGVPPGEFKLYKCNNSMWDVATPITVGGEHVGNLFSGQFFFEDEPVDYELFRSQAKLYGFDEREYITAIEEVPRLSRESLNEGMSFFMKLADMLSKLSYSNIKLARSLTERDTLMESLHRSRTLLSEAERLSHTGAWEWDLTADIWTFSDEWLAIHGCMKHTLVPSELLQIAHPDDRKNVEQAIKDAKDGIRPYEIEHRIIRQDTGEVRVVRADGQYVQNATGTVARVYGFAQDITEQKQAEEEIRKLNAELEQRVAQRTKELQTTNKELEAANKELEAFSYSVSHDLRAPLRAIDGFSNALLRNYLDSLDDRGQDYLQRVRAAAQRMGQLIDDILGLSRATRVEMHKQKVDLSAMASEILSELQNSQPERQAQINIEQGLVINADAHLLRVALDNLLGNAWKFTSKRDTATIEVGAFEQNDERVYFIKDNGAGFDPTYADKLFSPFQRLHTESEFPGTGIGLALVQRILRRHGGRIWAKSSKDQGATFFFTMGETGK